MNGLIEGGRVEVEMDMRNAGTNAAGGIPLKHLGKAFDLFARQILLKDRRK